MLLDSTISRRSQLNNFTVAYVTGTVANMTSDMPASDTYAHYDVFVNDTSMVYACELNDSGNYEWIERSKFVFNNNVSFVAKKVINGSTISENNVYLVKKVNSAVTVSVFNEGGGGGGGIEDAPNTLHNYNRTLGKWVIAEGETLANKSTILLADVTKWNIEAVTVVVNDGVMNSSSSYDLWNGTTRIPITSFTLDSSNHPLSIVVNTSTIYTSDIASNYNVVVQNQTTAVSGVLINITTQYIAGDTMVNGQLKYVGNDPIAQASYVNYQMNYARNNPIIKKNTITAEMLDSSKFVAGLGIDIAWDSNQEVMTISALDGDTLTSFNATFNCTTSWSRPTDIRIYIEKDDGMVSYRNLNSNKSAVFNVLPNTTYNVYFELDGHTVTDNLSTINISSNQTFNVTLTVS
jgi:hypothetical protein